MQDPDKRDERMAEKGVQKALAKLSRTDTANLFTKITQNEIKNLRNSNSHAPLTNDEVVKLYTAIFNKNEVIFKEALQKFDISEKKQFVLIPVRPQKIEANSLMNFKFDILDMSSYDPNLTIAENAERMKTLQDLSISANQGHLTKSTDIATYMKNYLEDNPNDKNLKALMVNDFTALNRTTNVQNAKAALAKILNPTGDPSPTKMESSFKNLSADQLTEITKSQIKAQEKNMNLGGTNAKVSYDEAKRIFKQNAEVYQNFANPDTLIIPIENASRNNQDSFKFEVIDISSMKDELHKINMPDVDIAKYFAPRNANSVDVSQEYYDMIENTGKLIVLARKLQSEQHLKLNIDDIAQELKNYIQKDPLKFLSDNNTSSASENTVMPNTTDVPKLPAHEIYEPETSKISLPWKTVHKDNSSKIKNRSGKSKTKEISSNDPFDIGSISKKDYPDISSKPATHPFEINKPSSEPKKQFSSKDVENSFTNPDLKPSSSRSPSEPKGQQQTPANPQRHEGSSNLNRDFGTQSKRQSLDDRSSNLDLPEPRNDQPDLSTKPNVDDETPRVRKLKPTQIIVSEPKIAQPIKTEITEIKNEVSSPKSNLSPQETWELKNRKKILKHEEKKLHKINKKLKKIPKDEEEKRKNLEESEKFVSENLQQKYQEFQKELQNLKKEHEEQIIEKARELAEIQKLKLEEELAAEKAQPLPDHEITTITAKYTNSLQDLYVAWKQQHPLGTKADFIDFELGLEGKESGTLNFTKAITKILSSDLKNYNQATQDKIILKLEQTFFNIANQPRKTNLDWKNTQAKEVQDKMIATSRSFVTKKVQDVLKDSGITSANNPLLYDKILDTLVSRNKSKEPLVTTDSDIIKKINEILENQYKIKQNQIQKINDTLSFYNSLLHPMQAKHMIHPETLRIQRIRDQLQNALDALQQPNADPLTANDFEKYENMYQEIYLQKPFRRN